MAANRKPHRPSKAEVKRRRLELAQQADQRVYLPKELQSYIDTYTPRNPEGRPMDIIRPFIVDVLARSNIRGNNSTKYHCTHLTEVAAYAISRGVPVTIETVLTTDLIDEYITIGMCGNVRNRQTRRERLMNLARTVNPGPTAPATLTPIPRQAIKPCYTPAEMAVIRRVIMTQPTKARTRDLCAVVALGAGAGADSTDLRHLRIHHIDDRDDDGIWVAFQQPRPRTVPVRVTYEGTLRAAIADRSADSLVIGRREDRTNLTTQIFERAVLHNVPNLEQARLRATWLADLMTDPVPIALILRAAGLLSARSLTDLLPHVDPWLAQKGIFLLASDVTGGGQQ